MSARGLYVPISTPEPWPVSPETVITAEAGLSLDPQLDMRVEPLVQAGDRVLQGAPILKHRRRPECIVTAPMSGRIAELQIGAGRRLTSLLIYSDDRLQSHEYEVRSAGAEVDGGSDSVALRTLLQASGLWMHFRARPFGGVPAGEGKPAAMFVMAADTRPLAADPRMALAGENAGRFQLGLQALEKLCDGPIYICQHHGPDIVPQFGRVKVIHVDTHHPAGLAGTHIQRLFPARSGRQVWEIAAEDVAAIGFLLTEARLWPTRLISVAGPGLRATRLVQCQPGADLRELSYAYMTPGPRILLSGSVLEGRESRWLGMRDRQATVMPRPDLKTHTHWLEAALRRASRAEPIIATAAVEHALGGAMPGMALLRALSVGDDETAAELGALSLLEEDLALADYVTAAAPRFSDLLRAALSRIEAMA